jgi:hypothetical protein
VCTCLNILCSQKILATLPLNEDIVTGVIRRVPEIDFQAGELSQRGRRERSESFLCARLHSLCVSAVNLSFLIPN